MGVPLLEQLGSPTCLVGPLHEVHRDLEVGRGPAEVDVLQLRVQRRERVHEGPEDVHLVDQAVLLHEQVLGHLAGTFGVAAVVVGVDVRLVRQGRLVGEHRLVRRWAGRLELLDQAVLAGPGRPGQGVVVEDAVGGALADHLPGADEGAVELGFGLHGEHAERRAPGLAEQVDVIGAEPVPQVVGHGDGVRDVAVQGDGVGRIQLGVGGAGSALVPGHDGEVLLEPGQVPPHRAELRTPGTPGEEEQDRVVGAGATDHQPEVVAPDVDGGQLGHGARERRSVGRGDRGGRRRPGQARGQRHECHCEDADDAAPQHPGGAT